MTTEKLRNHMNSTIFDIVNIDEIDNIKFSVEFNNKCYYFDTFKDAKSCFDDYCTDDKECDTFIANKTEIFLKMILLDCNNDCIDTKYLDTYTQYTRT